ncbi:biotin-dependent carboxyltransferase family protein [Sphingobacterium sp. BN32]|uniref:5-oxoprolinase subunit C family protein n=1 Tax=Sphingobacterium sp. BN32 TaxID=3058432 RepID=UPI00265CF7DE|nr:biotin-dependent carboxyltransferase family protein [Sphingobacterium sp. BN32]WKK56971.1 biotin-dependent carboxyltransferase family protein [Sphingobacterium sp. BN32]
MGISIIKAGLLSTVQDLGRWGFQRQGVPVSGAMDRLALRLGHVLLGNDESAAAIECTWTGPSIRFDQDQLISITGANLLPKLNGKEIAMWKPIYVPKDAVLSFGKADSEGCRAYICFYGGLDVPLVLGSRSTYLSGKMGGLNGQALVKGDQISFLKAFESVSSTFNWSMDSSLYPNLASRKIRIIAGPHTARLEKDSLSDLFKQSFEISNSSDRMGYRLKSKMLHLKDKRELLSSGVCFGTIQLPADGQPIILMADHGTTGGYPIIGQVASIDIPLLAQLKPGEHIQFEEIDLRAAQKLLLEQEQQINRLRQGVKLKYES